MNWRFFAPFGFAVGLGAAAFLNPGFSREIAQQTIASIDLLTVESARAQSAIAPPLTSSNAIATEAAVSNVLISEGCFSNRKSSLLRSRHLQSISLLTHIPTLPQRLNQSSLAQEQQLAIAPQSTTPEAISIRWDLSQAEASRSDKEPCLAHFPALNQRRFFPLQKPAHFILALTSSNPQNDPLPHPQAASSVHAVWHSQGPMQLKLASQFKPNHVDQLNPETEQGK